MVNGWTRNGDMKWPALPASGLGQRSSCSRSPACCGRGPRGSSGFDWARALPFVSPHAVKHRVAGETLSVPDRLQPHDGKPTNRRWSIGELEAVAYGPRLRLARLQPDFYEWFWTNRLA